MNYPQKFLKLSILSKLRELSSNGSEHIIKLLVYVKNIEYLNCDIKFLIYAKFWVKMTSTLKFYQDFKKMIFSLEIEKTRKWEKIKNF